MRISDWSSDVFSSDLVELSVNGLHSNYDAFEAFTGRIAGRISYDSTPIWQKRFTYAYGFELIGTSEDDYDFASANRQRQTYWLAPLPLASGLHSEVRLFGTECVIIVSSRWSR